MINVLLINHKTRNRLDIDDSIKVKRGSKDFQSQVKNTRNVVLASQISNFHKIGNWKHFQLEKKNQTYGLVPHGYLCTTFCEARPF